MVRLMACNAADGTACRMSGTSDMREAFTRACSDYRSLFPSGPEHEFVRLLRLACFGNADGPPAPARPAVPPFAKPVHATLDVGEISTVVPLATLLRLMFRDDKTRFERDHGIRFTATGSTVGSDARIRSEMKLVDRLGRVPSAERWFRIGPDESHGRPYVWFTARQDLENAFVQPQRRGLPRANIARDVLGLAHHGPKARGSDGPNHLVALHFPAAIAARAGYLRPSAVQAFDNRRFILRFGDGDQRGDADWGSALDLHLFASTAKAPIGSRERILVRLQRSLFQDDDAIQFEYLGAVSDLRGNIRNLDDDDSFLDLVRRGRDTDGLKMEICR